MSQYSSYPPSGGSSGPITNADLEDGVGGIYKSSGTVPGNVEATLESAGSLEFNNSSAQTLLLIDNDTSTVSVPAITETYVQSPTNLVATRVVAPQYEGWPEVDYLQINFRVYSFKEHTSSGIVYYSPSYTDLSVPLNGDGTYDGDTEEPWFNANLVWDAPLTGNTPDGYRIFVRDPDYSGWEYDAYIDVYAATTVVFSLSSINESDVHAPNSIQVNNFYVNANSIIEGGLTINAPSVINSTMTFNDFVYHYAQTYFYNTLNMVGAEIVSDSLATLGSIFVTDYKFNSLYLRQNGTCIKIGSETATFPNDSVHIGSTSGRNSTGDRNVAIGIASLNHSSGTTIYDSVAIGQNALKDSPLGYYAVAIGGGALQGVGTVYTSVGAGFQAGYLATYVNNSFLGGFWAGKSASNINNAVLIGVSAGESANSNFGVFIGYQAGKSGTNATNSVAIGSSAMINSTNANLCTAVGTGSFANAASATSSTGIGGLSGGSATNASFALFAGYEAGNTATNGKYLIALGYRAGYQDTANTTSAGWNILLGRNTNTAGFTDTICIGGYTKASANRQLNIANTIYATNIYNTTTQSATPVTAAAVGVGTATPRAKFDVLSTTEQLRATYTDNSVYTSFTTSSVGNLTIAPTGTTATVSKALLNQVLISPKTTTPVTVATTDSNTYFTNTAATAQIVFNLPASAVGLVYKFIVTDTDGIRVKANTGDVIRILGSVSTSAGYAESFAIGDILTVICTSANNWTCEAFGTWTLA